MATYAMQYQWGGNNEPWHPGGNWVIDGDPILSLNVTSSDNGQNLTGVLQQTGEGGVDAQASLCAGDNYTAQVQWGGSHAQWNPAGTWSFAGNQILNVNVTSTNNGSAIGGSAQFTGIGPYAVQGTLQQ